MKSSFIERAWSAILIVPTIIVVLALAGLLYRWSNQMSETTTVRLADSLQMSMVNWHLNLFRDISDIGLVLRDAGNSDDMNTYEHRVMLWRATAPYPDLIARLYILKSSDSAWPPQLNSLRSELEQARPTTAIDNAPHDNFYPGGGDTADWRFESGIPVLVRPVAHGWLVVELSREVIQTRLLPDLARRYFTGIDGLDYKIAVVSNSFPRQVIYSSDPDFGVDEIPDADGRMDVFERTPKTGSSITLFHKPLENPGLTTTIGTSWFPLIGKAAGEGDWQLVVRHRRGGALGAFVAEMHRRDLAISFGVLFLLIVSVAILIVVSQRARRLAKLQMDFVTTVSHELRTPLTIISSAAENIAHGVVEGRQQMTQYGAVIEGRARQLSRLVEEILLFAATRENRQRYNPRPLEVRELIDATLAATTDLIEASEFTLEQDIPSVLPRLTGDLFALSQCLQNLITNALKYGGPERWIGLKVVVVESEIQIRVSDRGMGISSRDLPHVFDPFYRTESAAAAQIHGTGLGLALAKNIAEAMHGRLSVVSEPGRGSTFTLHLPSRDMGYP